MKEGSKYQPLLDYLRENRTPDEVTLSFADIEALIHTPLPSSARTQQAWWSNRKKGALQAAAWMEAGYRVEAVDLDGERVTFRKPIQKVRVRQMSDAVQWNGELIKALRIHMGLTQAEFGEHIGVRQATVSDWEQGLHTPSRAMSMYLSLVADRAGFSRKEES